PHLAVRLDVPGSDQDLPAGRPRAGPRLGRRLSGAAPADRPADAMRGRPRRGRRNGVASRRAPDKAIAGRGPRVAPRTPQAAVSTAVAALVVTDQADSVRATRSAAVRRRRKVAQTGLNTAQQRISPDSTAITSSSPPVPGPTNAKPTGQ